MAKQRPSRKQVSDITGYEILVKLESGEATTMALADFIREHAGDIANTVFDSLKAGEPVEVVSDGGTYTVRLLQDGEENRHGRFTAPRDRTRASDTGPALWSVPVLDLEAVG